MTTEMRMIIGIAAMMLLFGSLIVALVIGQRKKIRYHRNLQDLMQKDQELLAEQNRNLEQKVAQRTAELAKKNETLNQSLEDLRTTQEQLIQREKLASLGELTAGIAHEIKNPLNFVTNFAELSLERLTELTEAMQSGSNTQEIVDELKQNLEKINLHGKRADSIVKAMLSHARSSTDQKETIHINDLVDECLRLSYHGMRAQNKTFNATLETTLADGLPPIVVNPQDMGRVLLNIFNNAFYAITHKAASEGPNYNPTLTTTTCLKKQMIEIVIEDNGGGIPTAVRDKIFQPFFTTKPTGEGTGLGLSISYDIVTKGHGGRLQVNSDAGTTQFTISLPVKPVQLPET